MPSAHGHSCACMCTASLFSPVDRPLPAPPCPSLPPHVPLPSFALRPASTCCTRRACRWLAASAPAVRRSQTMGKKKGAEKGAEKKAPEASAPAPAPAKKEEEKGGKKGGKKK
jgi:hypothetical protein